MKKIAKKEINEIMDEIQMPTSIFENVQPIDIYHINNWDYNIKHWDEASKRNENPPLREFYFDLKEMLNFIRSYLGNLIFKEAIIKPRYAGRFIKVPNNEIDKYCVDEITKWLHTNSMRINSCDGLLITKEELMDSIDTISESGFWGTSELCIIIPKAFVFIEVHHHMNYLVYTNDLENQKSIIKRITDLHENINMYYL